MASASCWALHAGRTWQAGACRVMSVVGVRVVVAPVLDHDLRLGEAGGQLVADA